MTSKETSPHTKVHPDQQPFADFIWDQTQYPEEGWENHTIGSDPVALAMLDALDHWRRNQDSEAAIELLERAITTLRWYQGVPPKHATSQTSGGT